MEAAKRVVKNTGILYLRMAITVFISLYSTRLILAALGIADFGLFNLVGGVISMLGFINSSMAAATQRFISFAQGEGDIEKVKRIFNMSTLLHWGIAILVFILLEGAGYFFFDRILNIPTNRIEDAKLIYQFMVISTLFTVISVPYEAIITSHENMLVYAIMGVIEAVLKLSIAIYITYTGMDHLVIYGLLMATLSIFLMLIKRIYCHRVYDECHLQMKQYFDKPLIKEMGGYAGFSLMGISSAMIANYGSSIILNIFFGTIVNAAQGVVVQISAQLSFLGNTVTKVINPLITKSLGSGNRDFMLNVSLFSTKISFFLIAIVYLPFLVHISFLLKMWLNIVPIYTSIFCVFQLTRNLIEQLYLTLSSTIAAEGKIKSYSICISVLNLLPLPLSYILFIIDFPPYFLYLIFTIYSILNGLVVLYFVNRISHLSIDKYFKEVFLRCLLCFFVALSISFISKMLFSNTLVSFLFSSIIGVISLTLLIWVLGLNLDEKKLLKGMTLSVIKSYL